MKIIIEMEGNDPRLPAVLAAAAGATLQTSAPVADTPKPAPAPTKPKVEAPKADPVDEGNGSAASSDAPDQPKTTAPSPASTSAPSGTTEGDDKITLPKLQAFAARLLEAGERRTLKSILDENGCKSLSTAPEDAYEMLFGALSEAVAALPA